MKRIIIVATIILFANLLKAQDLNANWSDKELYKNKETGFFDDFIGSNSKFVYAKCSKIPAFRRASSKAGEKKSKINIIAYDKITMKKVADATILDLSNGATSKKYDGLRYYQTIVFENIIYVFWVVDNKTKDELYVQSYDAKLKKLNPLKKIYELTSSKGDLKKAELFVMGNQKAGEKIIIGGELAVDEGQNIKMEYKVLNSDFTFAASNQVTLPVVAAKKAAVNMYGQLRFNRGSDALSSEYEFGDDGNLHLKTYVRVTDEEKKDIKKDKDKKGTALSYAIYSIVNVNTGKINSFSMRADNKNILEFDFEVTKNTIKLYGFFNDITKSGYLDGIFSGTVDPKTLTISKLNFTYFTKDQLTNLFAKDKEDAAKPGIFASKKKKEAAKDNLSSYYKIEDVQVLDKDNLVIICSKMWNYSVTTCNGKGQCTTRYYCQKDNVTVFKVSTKGDITWATNIDRRKTYGGWWVYDVKSTNNGKNIYVAYGSDFNTLEKTNGKSKKSRKSKDQRTDRFEYSVIDYNTGAAQKKEFKINSINAQKEDKKKIDVLKIDVVDNQFYVNSTVGRLKPLPTVLTCIGALVCIPVAILPFMLPSYKKWTGFNGRIAPMK